MNFHINLFCAVFLEYLNMTNQLITSINKINSVYDLSLEGRLDASSSSDLGEKLKNILSSPHVKVVVDCSNLNYLSSAGMRFFLMSTKTIKANFGQICFCHFQPDVMEIIKMAGFESILKIFPTKDEALASFL
ncbi:MAG: STAS domain-containing protein [Rhabdochlamydiaceae bacterium]